MNDFYNFLLSIGFNSDGASEVINRINHNRADQNDIALLERFKAAER